LKAQPQVGNEKPLRGSWSVLITSWLGAFASLSFFISPSLRATVWLESSTGDGRRFEFEKFLKFTHCTINKQLVGRYGVFTPYGSQGFRPTVAAHPCVLCHQSRSVNKALCGTFTSEAERLYTQWPKLPLENKRSILESIVEKITVGKDEIDLTLSYLPSSEELVKNQQAV